MHALTIRHLTLGAGILLFQLGCGQAAQEEATLDWPQFRGPGGRAISDDHPLPTTWSDGSDNIRWNTDLPGVGNSSPIVVGDRIFLTAIERTDQPRTSAPPLERRVFGVDLGTGKLLWQTDVFAARPEIKHRLNTSVAPTPVTDGESIWAYFGSHLARLSLDGELLWAKVVDPTYPKYNRYGVASSLVLAGDLVVVAQDREYAETPDIGWMAAFDQLSGNEVWRREWDDSCCTYSSPVVWQRSGRPELLHAESGAILGLDVTTGKELWRQEHGQYQVVSSLVFEDDVVCSLGGAHGNKGNLCVRVTEQDGQVRVDELWSTRRHVPETSSPVLYRGRIFAITEGGVMTCYDPESGKVHWFGRVPETAYRSALVAGDGKVYARSTWGSVAVVDADADELRVLSVNELSGSENNSSPALAGGCLLLRTADGLACIEADREQT